MTLDEARSLRDGQVLHSDELHILECYYSSFIPDDYEPAIQVICPPIGSLKIIPIVNLSLGKKQFGSGQHHHL